ncbi:hypothetical protein NQZ68_005392 [Dissostichus eleginoides]|nr:hypothetical protein NQZ68_005392 [Dissostichus eleginoides]
MSANKAIDSAVGSLCTSTPSRSLLAKPQIHQQPGELGFAFNDRDVCPGVLPTRLTHPGEINHNYGSASGRGRRGGNSMEAWVVPAGRLPNS